MRPPDGTAWDAYMRELETAADQQRRVSSSVESGQEERAELETHKPWSEAKCGPRMLLADSQRPGSIMAAQPPCKRKGCAVCGPVTRRQTVRHFLAMMDGHQMRRRPLEKSARRSALAKLRRAGHQWVPIPAPDGRLIVYATGGVGELVTDLEARLTTDVDASPVGTRITPCREWARQPVASRGGNRWKLLGVVRVTLAQLVQLATEHGYYRGQVAENALPAEWIEAHLLQQPDDEVAWQRFKRRIGLYWPEPATQRRRAA